MARQLVVLLLLAAIAMAQNPDDTTTEAGAVTTTPVGVTPTRVTAKTSTKPPVDHSMVNATQLAAPINATKKGAEEKNAANTLSNQHFVIVSIIVMLSASAI